MSNLVKATVTIVGTRALMWHRFGPDALPLEKQERTGVAGNDPEEWKKTVLMTADRQLYVEPSYVFGCLRNAARHTRKKMGSIQKDVAATLQVMDARVLVDRFVPEEASLTQSPDQPVYLDVRGVRNPGSKGMNVRYRVTASPGWKASFTIIWDRTIVSTAQMQAVLIDAGRLEGIGDGRSIGFGRFEVESFNIAT